MLKISLEEEPKSFEKPIDFIFQIFFFASFPKTNIKFWLCSNFFAGIFFSLLNSSFLSQTNQGMLLKHVG